MAMKKKSAKKTTPKKKATTKKAPKKAAVKKAAPKKKAAKKKAAKKKAAKKLKKGAAPQLTKAQSKENLNLLIGRAITDRKFRALVTKTPERALRQYPLLEPEKIAVLSAAKNPLAAGQAIDRLVDDTIGPLGAI